MALFDLTRDSHMSKKTLTHNAHCRPATTSRSMVKYTVVDHTMEYHTAVKNAVRQRGCTY